MRSMIILFCLILAPSVVNAQNLIQNPGFENGPIPTGPDQVSKATGWSKLCGRVWTSTSTNGAPGSPDLFDSRSSDCFYGIPSNKWGVRYTRAGGFRYVGFSGWSTQGGPQWFGETVEGSLTAPLRACNYQVSFWASAVDGIRYVCNQPITPYGASPYDKIQVVLRQGSNCSLGKSVYTSPSITSNGWQQYTGQFSLSAADAAAGYDRIEFRLVQELTHVPSTFHIVYLDDVELITQGQLPNPNFQLTATIPSGNATTYQLTATAAFLPSGASFWWRVEEIDLTTGNALPNTTVTNPAPWWANPLTNVFSGYNSTSNLGNISNIGVFQQAHKYRISRGVWSDCSPWTAISKTVFMCTGCRAIEVKGDTHTTAKPAVLKSALDRT